MVAIRIPQGNTVLDLPVYAGRLAFSPDSSLLAVADVKQKAILVYRVTSR